MEKTLPPFGVSFSKSFLLKIGYSKPSQIVVFWTFHISVFVNMTNIVVKSYTVLYMHVEVRICQSVRHPERLIISQTHSIGDFKLHQVGEGIWRTLPLFGVRFAKPFLLKIGYSKPPKLWYFGPSTFLYLPI